MSTFATLTAAIIAQLNATAALEGVAWVLEDTADLDTEIAEQLGQFGMMGLIGIPRFENQAPFGSTVTATVKLQLLLSEVPSVWREDNDTPHCQDIARIAAAALQGLQAPGFNKLRVMTGEPTGVDKADPKFQYFRLDLETNLTLSPT